MKTIENPVSPYTNDLLPLVQNGLINGEGMEDALNHAAGAYTIVHPDADKLKLLAAKKEVEIFFLQHGTKEPESRESISASIAAAMNKKRAY